MIEVFVRWKHHSLRYEEAQGRRASFTNFWTFCCRADIIPDLMLKQLSLWRIRITTFHQLIATMLSTLPSIIVLMLLFTTSFNNAAASARAFSFPNMVCRGSGGGTCTANKGYCFQTCAPGAAPFFTFGPAGNGSTCYSGSASKRMPDNKISTNMNMRPAEVKPRKRQGIFVQNTGLTLPKGHCIISCDSVHLNYVGCSSSCAASWLPDLPSGMTMALGCATLLWLCL